MKCYKLEESSIWRILQKKLKTELEWKRWVLNIHEIDLTSILEYPLIDTTINPLVNTDFMKSLNTISYSVDLKGHKNRS